MGQSPWLYNNHTMDDLSNIVKYCAETYFCQPNYLKIDGKPVFVIYQPNLLMDELKDACQIHEPLSHMNDQAKRYGFDGIYYIANIGCLGGNAYSARWDLSPKLLKAGYDAFYPYNLCSTERAPQLPPAFSAMNNSWSMPSRRVIRSSWEPRTRACWQRFQKRRCLGYGLL